MKPLAPFRFLTALAAIALAACSQQPGQNPAAPTPAATAAPVASTPVISAPAQAGSAGLPGDHATTKRYRIAINLPVLPADAKPLAGALRTTADDAKREFLQALPDPKQMPEFANRQFELLLDFKLAADTSAFTSVRETGMQDTGGAHPLPVQAAFVFDRKGGKLLALDDLFAQPDAARTALANYAHDTLLKKLMANAPTPSEGSPEAIREWKANTVQMLDDGTRPTEVNYSVFIVRTGATADAQSPGLTLIFPPYQVAPYVDGTQTVDVPASVFAKFLKPAYQSDFAAQ
ncbi:MAG TPA: RsiV family protein [Rhodanobacteraceae bacterium]